MAYTPFNAARPDVAATGATRTSEIDFARSNDTALADMLASIGWMDNFNLSITGGTALVPTQILATNGTQRVKLDITYGSGVTAGLVTVIAVSKSINGGSSYSSVRTCTVAYDGSGNFLSTTWS